MLRLQPTLLTIHDTSCGLTRRRFLQHTPLLVAGATVLGLTACGGASDPAGEDDTNGDGTNDDTTDDNDTTDDGDGTTDDDDGGVGPEGVEVAMAAGLKNVDGTQIVNDQAVLSQLDTDNNDRGNDPILLVRVDVDTIAANTIVCTHQQCQVGYNDRDVRLDCPCHGSRYDLNGRVIQGPAPRALKHFNAVIHGDSVFLSDV